MGPMVLSILIPWDLVKPSNVLDESSLQDLSAVTWALFIPFTNCGAVAIILNSMEQSYRHRRHINYKVL